MLSSQSLNPTQAAAYHSPKLPNMEQIVPFKDGNRNKQSLNYQFGNKLFHPRTDGNPEQNIP